MAVPASAATAIVVASTVSYTHLTFGPTEGISSIHLIVKGKVPGVDAAVFTAAVEDAKANCPVSKALAAVPTTAEATLEL